MPQPPAPLIPLSEDHPSVVGGRSHQVRLVGVVDAFSARSVELQLLPLAASQAQLVVDLTQVRVLTSGGLSMLLRCRDRSARLGHRLHLRARSATLVQRVLTLAGVPHEVVPG